MKIKVHDVDTLINNGSSMSPSYRNWVAGKTLTVIRKEKTGVTSGSSVMGYSTQDGSEGYYITDIECEELEDE